MKRLLMVALLLVSSSIQAYTWKDAKCLADNAFYEARGEGIKGMQAVMDVTLNRLHSDKFPDTVCKVVYQKSQFTWTSNPKPVIGSADKDARIQADLLARAMLIGYGRGVTKGALYYHERSIKPRWIGDMRRVKRINKHIFYVAKS